MDIFEKIRISAQDRYYVTVEEALIMKNPIHSTEWIHYSKLPIECKRIPRVIGAWNGVLIIEREEKSLTVKEKVALLIGKYEHIIVDNEHIHITGKASEGKAFLREVVDYAISTWEIIQINLKTTCNSDMKTGKHDIYEDLGI